MMEDLPGKRLEILKETVPQLSRIAVLGNPANPNPSYGTWMHSLTVAARGLGLQLHVVELRRADELDSAFVAMTRADADALIVMRIDARTATLARLLPLSLVSTPKTSSPLQAEVSRNAESIGLATLSRLARLRPLRLHTSLLGLNHS